MKNYEIEIPISACRVSPIMITPFATDEHLSELYNVVSEGRAYRKPIVRDINGQYEVVLGWECLEIKKALGKERVMVERGEYTNVETIPLAILQQGEIANSHWISIAQSLAFAKRHYQLSDLAIADATNIGRTTIMRKIAIAEKLIPDFLTLAKLDRLSYTTCRKLVTLTKEDQTLLAEEAFKKNWDDRAFRKKLGIGAIKSVPVMSSNDTPERKDIHLQRLEITISEQVGFPVTINQLDGNRGTIDFQFFSRADMIETISKSRKGFSANADVKGRLTLEYENLDNFQDLVGGFLQED